MTARGRLFVYGTLLPGEPRWPVLERVAVRVVDATAAGHLYDTGHGYPAAVFTAAGGTIAGALVIVDDAAWDEVIDRLDRIEGEGELYRRMECDVDGKAAVSYEWIGSISGFTPLPDGWRHRAGAQNSSSDHQG